MKKKIVGNTILGVSKKLLSILLSICMLLSITAGIDFYALANDGANKITISSQVENATSKMVFSYAVKINGEPYSGTAVGKEGAEYGVTNGIVSFPANDSATITIPLNSKYEIKRLEFEADGYYTLPESEVEAGTADNFNYYEQIDGYDYPISPEEYNEATNNGTLSPAIVTYYTDPLTFERYKKSEVTSNVFYNEGVEGETSQELFYKKGEEAVYPSSLKITTAYSERKATTSIGKDTYYYTGEIAFSIGDVVYSETYTVPSTDKSQVKATAATMVKTTTRTIVLRALNELTKDKTASAFLTSSIDEIMPSASDFGDSTSPVELVNEKLSVCELVPLEKEICLYVKEACEGVKNIDFYGELVYRHYHNYSNDVVAPTCTEKGYTTHTCLNCSESYIDDYVDALGHTAVTDNAVAPTCTSTGLTAGSHCSVCNEIFVEQEIIPAIGHREIKQNVIIADCLNDGYSGDVYCVDCNTLISKGEVISAVGHKYSQKVILPTCTSNGYTEYLCINCGDTYNSNYTEKTDHNYKSTITNPTCTEYGYTTKTCTECGDVIKCDITEPTNHTFVTIEAKEPTCLNNGRTEGKYCSKCGYVEKESVILNSTGHNVCVKEAVSPTCTATGLTAGTYCSVCNTTIEPQKIVPATGHISLVDYSVTPTCTATGLTEGSHCSICNTVLVEQKAVPMISHSYVATVTTEPTCTQEGVRTYTCSSCKASYTESIPATGHSAVVDYAVTPTCTATGLTEGSHCSVCNTVLVEQKAVPMISHSYVATVTTEPTCAQEGVRTYTCSSCNASYTETIPATGHTIVTDKAVKATYAKAGKTEGKHCKTCGEVLVAQKKVAKLTVPKITLSSVKSKKSKQITVAWKKNTKVTGYQIQYATNSGFTKNKKTVTVSKNSTTSKTITKLKGKTKYYVRIRAYKVENGKKYYSSWSTAKSVTTKK